MKTEKIKKEAYHKWHGLEKEDVFKHINTYIIITSKRWLRKAPIRLWKKGG